MTNESVYHPGKQKILLWNRYTEVRLAVKKDERHFNYVFQVFTHVALVMYKMFVQCRKCLGTDTQRTSPFTTPERQMLALKPRNRGTLGCKKDERHFNNDFQVFEYIELVIHKVFISFRKCLGTDTPWTSQFTTPERQKSRSETPERRNVRL